MLPYVTLKLSNINLESTENIKENVTLMVGMLHDMCDIVKLDPKAGIEFNPHERSIRVLSSMLIYWILFYFFVLWNMPMLLVIKVLKAALCQIDETK